MSPLLSFLSPDPSPPADADRPTRRPLTDLGVFAFALALGVVFTASDRAEGIGAPPLPLDVAVGVIAGAALVLRHRWPTQLAVGLTVTTLMLSTIAAGPALAALFAVARRRPPATAVAVAAVYVLTTIPRQVAYPPADGTVLGAAVTAAVLIGAVTVAGMFARARAQSRRERERRLEEEHRAKITQARQHERARIAREMHDVLGHRISLLSLHAGALELRAGESEAEVAHRARTIREGAHEALDELREVIGVLRANGASGEEVTTRPQPNLTDLPELIEECRRAGMRISFEQRVDGPEAIPEGTGRHAYRIVQEGLTNARKHAPTAPVRVEVSGSAATGLSIEVLNPRPAEPSDRPGAGAAAIPGAGAGLVGLGERIDLAGGRLTHGPVAATGEFRLAGWLP